MVSGHCEVLESQTVTKSLVNLGGWFRSMSQAAPPKPDSQIQTPEGGEVDISFYNKRLIWQAAKSQKQQQKDSMYI